MICTSCSEPNTDNARFCTRCGGALTSSISQSGQVPFGGGEPATAETSGKAIASLVFGCFSFIFPAAIVAIILGHISRSQIRTSAGRLKGSGLAMAGLVLGYMGMVTPVVLIFAAIIIPNLLRARISADEASAVASIKAINTAELSYETAYPMTGYAPNLSSLGGANPCHPSPASACLIDNTLATGMESGYNFAAVGGNPVNGVNTTYVAGAAPTSYNQSGVRQFCSSEDKVIRWDANTGKSTSPPSAAQCQGFTSLQ